MDALVGKEMRYIGRAGNMLWVGIGPDADLYIERNDEHRVVAEYAIHVQCPWRFSNGDVVLVASGDIYRPYDEALEYHTDWDWDVFDRCDEESSIFDVMKVEMNKTWFPSLVEVASINSIGDLHVELQNGIEFDIFINSARSDEFYRILDFVNDVHTVFFEEDE